MFCTECGKEIPEGARFCVNCGTSAAKSPIGKKLAAKSTEDKKPGQNQLEAGKAMLEKLEAIKPVVGKAVQEKLEAVKPMGGEIGKKLKIKLDKKKLLAIGAVVVVLLFFLLFKGGGKGAGAGFSSPEEAFNAWMTGLALHDFNLTLQAEPDFVIEYEGGEAGAKETLQRNYDRDIAKYADIGTSFRYETIGHYMLEEQFELDEFEQRIRYTYGVDIKISALAVVHYIRYDTKNGTEEMGISGTNSFAFEYNGNWYYLPMESDYNISV